MSKERFKLIPAVYLVLRKDNEVLLSQRTNTGYQDGMYSLVAGHLDGNELATVGMIREAQEEAGIQIQTSDLKLAHVSHRLNRETPGQERMDLFFECTAWQGTITNKELEKCGDLSWYDLNALPENMLPHIRNVLKNISQGVSFSEYVTEPKII